MRKRSRDDSSSDSETEGDPSIFITKNSLVEAVALVVGNNSAADKDAVFGGTKVLRECQSASLKAHNLGSAADIFTQDNSTTEMLEELRLSLLQNNRLSAAKILQALLQSAGKPVLPVIWKVLAVMMLNQELWGTDHLKELIRMCTQGTEDFEQHFIESLLLLPDSLVSKSKKKLNQNGSVDEVIEVSDEEDPEVIELE